MMVRLGDAHGLVAGSNSPTSDVLRAAMFLLLLLWKQPMVNLETMD